MLKKPIFLQSWTLPSSEFLLSFNLLWILSSIFLCHLHIPCAYWKPSTAALPTVFIFSLDTQTLLGFEHHKNALSLLWSKQSKYLDLNHPHKKFQHHKPLSPTRMLTEKPSHFQSIFNWKHQLWPCSWLPMAACRSQIYKSKTGGTSSFSCCFYSYIIHIIQSTSTFAAHSQTGLSLKQACICLELTCFKHSWTINWIFCSFLVNGFIENIFP